MFRSTLGLLAVGAALFACSSSTNVESGSDEIDSTPQGPYKLFFTNPMQDLLTRKVFDDTPVIQEIIKTDIANGRHPDEELVRLMDSATGAGCSVLAANYDFDMQNIADALVRAKKRGCDVRFITDGDIICRAKPDADRTGCIKAYRDPYLLPFKTLRDGGVPIHHDGTRGSIMHNKFAVINSKTVWTGTWNWSSDDTEKFWNTGFTFESEDIAKRYTIYFESLYAHWDENGIATKGWKRPTDLGSNQFTLGKMPVEVYFPSNEKVIPRLTQLAASARKSIHFLAFSFTADELGTAMIERAKEGVEIRGVFENSGACNGQYRVLTDAALPNISLSRWQYGPGNFMHHKVLIVDSETVAFGSFNFSDSAETGNDENILIIKDKKLASLFEKEYKLVEKATANMRTQAPDCKVAGTSAADDGGTPDSPPSPENPVDPSDAGTK